MKLSIQLTFLCCFSILIGLISCKEDTESQNTSKQTNGKNVSTEKNFSPKKQYDYRGVYEGTLPCKSCEGIALKIKLQKDQHFRLEKSFIGGTKNGTIRTKSGKYEWNAKDSIISLSIGSEKRFLVRRRHLILLNSIGPELKTTGEHLMLSKTEDFDVSE